MKTIMHLGYEAPAMTEVAVKVNSILMESASPTNEATRLGYGNAEEL